MEIGSSSTSSTRSLVYRPSTRFRVYDASYAAIWATIPEIIASLAIGAPWGYTAAVIPIVMGVWAARRAFRIRLVVTEHEVRVTNFWRTYVIPWDDVVAVAMMAVGKFAPIPTGHPAIGFFRRNGRQIRAQATPRRDSETAAFQADVMALAPDSVRALTPPPDWWADQDKPRRG